MNLPNELIVMIMDFMDDNNKLVLFQTSKQLQELRNLVQFQIFISNHLIKNRYVINLTDAMVTKVPQSIKYLTMDESFNSRVDIRINLRYLKFNNEFNKKIIYLPDSLQILIFGKQFNQDDHYLPPFLTHLTYGDDFNHEINLPKTLIFLNLGKKFNQKITFPESLKTLIMYGSIRKIDALPINLVNLKFSVLNKTIDYPLSLKKLTHINEDYYKSTHAIPNVTYYNTMTIETILPESVTHLKCNAILTRIPSNVKYLSIGNYDNLKFCNFSKITHLRIMYHFDKIHDKFPPYLSHLRIRDEFSNTPPTLRYLHCHVRNDYIPENLTHLVLNYGVINLGILPITLRLLKVIRLEYQIDYLINLKYLFCKFIDASIVIPNSVRYLKVNDNYDVPRFVKYCDKNW